MSPLFAFIIVLLIPAGLLPVVTAIVLRRYRDARSQALRDRYHVAIVLAVLGGITTFLALNRLHAWLSGEIVAIPFAIVLLAVDVISAKWLLDFHTGKFR